MLRHLGLRADGEWFMLDGYDLLVIMDTAVVVSLRSATYPSEGNGSLMNPFRMDQPSQWQYVGHKTESPKKRYYRVGGRIIYKDAVNYT